MRCAASCWPTARCPSSCGSTSRADGAIVTAEATGSATANQVAAYRVAFGVLDVTARMNLLVQLNPTPSGALACYDSADRASSLTYVTVEQAPTED